MKHKGIKEQAQESYSKRKKKPSKDVARVYLKKNSRTKKELNLKPGGKQSKKRYA